ncbi:MAG: hypothetical protein ACLT98_13140 [Eggerthellaceae bacterium]
MQSDTASAAKTWNNVRIDLVEKLLVRCRSGDEAMMQAVGVSSPA